MRLPLFITPCMHILGISIYMRATMNDGCEEERDEYTQICPDCKAGLQHVTAHHDHLRSLREMTAADALDAMGGAPRYHGP